MNIMSYAVFLKLDTDPILWSVFSVSTRTPLGSDPLNIYCFSGGQGCSIILGEPCSSWTCLKHHNHVSVFLRVETSGAAYPREPSDIWPSRFGGHHWWSTATLILCIDSHKGSNICILELKRGHILQHDRYTFAILFTYCYTDFVSSNPENLEDAQTLKRYFGSVPVLLDWRDCGHRTSWGKP